MPTRIKIGFVPAKMAIEGLSSDQAIWKDSTGNHSIIEIVSHIMFWNERNLRAFKGEAIDEFSNDNEETFLYKNAADWPNAVARLDSVQRNGNEPLRMQLMIR